jgi:hypothetical protein
MPKGASDLINLGRHHNQGIIADSRRTHRVNNDLTANANHIFLFKHILPKDIDYLKKVVPDADKCKILKEYHYLYFNAKDSTTTECAPVSKFSD